MPDQLVILTGTIRAVTATGTDVGTGTGEAFWVRDRIVPTLMWGRERGPFHSRVHVANYYSLLRPDDRIEATVVIDLIDSVGAHVASYQQELGPEEHVQVEVSALVPEFEGTIAVRLLPHTSIEHSHRYLGTLYFVSWYDDAGHVQFSHEQNRMTFDVDQPVRTFLSPGIFLRPELTVSAVLQNNYFGAAPLPTEDVELALVDVDGTELAVETVRLPARHARVFPLAELFPDAIGRERGTVAVRARGRHLNHPFTFVQHANDDFSIHHF